LVAPDGELGGTLREVVVAFSGDDLDIAVSVHIAASNRYNTGAPVVPISRLDVFKGEITNALIDCSY